MTNLDKYLKYYFLEDFLFKEISANFQRNKCLTAEEFFAIVIWKRNASKTKIKDSLIKDEQTVEGIKGITGEIHRNRDDRKKQVELLTGEMGIGQIGISIASAILAVCYPTDFTIVDYRVCNSLNREPFKSDPVLLEKFPNGISDLAVSSSADTYLMYVDVCKKLASKYGFKMLRDFDRILWGMDFYEGRQGLKELEGRYCRKELEKKNPKKLVRYL